MSSTREQIIETTCELLEAQGYHATGLSQIVRESGAPRGSLYYYFPEGKEELAAEAVRRVGDVVAERIHSVLGAVEDPAEAVEEFIRTLAGHMAASEYRAGGPITTVALESATTSERLNEACREVYAQWQAAFAQKLVSSGLEEGRAQRLAALIIASLEGGIVLSRTEHTTASLEAVAAELAALIRVTVGEAMA